MKEIQQASVQEILKAQNEKEFLSEEDIQQLQSKLITSSLLAFQEQLETERRVAEERVALERQRELDKQRRKEEREREQQEQQRLEAQRQEERQQQAQQRQEELEAQHKKQLQSIIESRYARFEAATPKSVEEELESFKTVEDLELATARLQKLQSSSFNQTLQTCIDAEAERHAAELEAKDNKRNVNKCRIEAETAARIEAEKEEERKRKEAHRVAEKTTRGSESSCSKS